MTDKLWIPHDWRVGVCPVDGGTVVDVMFSDTDIRKNCKASAWYWDANSVTGIIAYRVIKTAEQIIKECPHCQKELKVKINKKGHRDKLHSGMPLDEAYQILIDLVTNMTVTIEKGE